GIAQPIIDARVHESDARRFLSQLVNDASGVDDVPHQQRQDADRVERYRSEQAHRSAQELSAEVLAERSGDADTAILLLMVLEDRGDDAGEREPRAVESVNEARLSAFGRLVPDVGAASLEVGEVAARGDLEPFPDAGRVTLQIVGVGAGKSGVARSQSNDAIG